MDNQKYKYQDKNEELIVNLLFVIRNNKILLAEKKRGFGVGVFNGCGGKVEQDETIEQSMVREATEEFGIIPKNLEKVAINIFNIIHKGKRKNLVTHVFKTNEFEGEIAESDEMKPEWFDLEKIPYTKMWQDDALWLPRVLAGEKLKTYFYFDDNDIMGEYKIETVYGFEN